MAASMIPTLPDDTALSQQLPSRPQWTDILAYLRDMDGKDLVDAGLLGEEEAQRIHDLDTSIKKYEPQFKKWYWDSAMGKVEEAAKQFAKVRLAELARCEEARTECDRILGQRQQIIDDRAAARQREIEAERLAREKETRERELAELKAQQEAAPPERQAELAAHIEQRATEPLVPVSVGTKEVLATMTGAKAPAGFSGRKVYVRQITDMAAFLRWLAANPAWANTLNASFSFAKVKGNDMQIPGVKMTVSYETANRAK